MAYKRKRSYSYTNNKRRKNNVQPGTTFGTAILSNGVRGSVPPTAAIHKRTYRGAYKRPSKGLRNARKGNVGTKPSTIITSQMMNYKVKPNQKGILGLMASKITIMDPFSTVGSANELGGGYQIPDVENTTLPQIADQYDTYELMYGDTETTRVLSSHRTDWCMFNNWQWRDNLCYLLGAFANSHMPGTGGATQPSIANPQIPLVTNVTAWSTNPYSTGANGTAMWGYAPPNTYTPTVTSGSNQTPYGFPVIGINNGSFPNSAQSNLNQPILAGTSHYVLNESITWYVHNQGATDLTVILNECTLKYDIPIINGVASFVDTPFQTLYGGMPDPRELWANSRTRQAFADQNNTQVPNQVVVPDVADYIQGYSTNNDRLNNDITDIGNNTKYADRLNACYNVKKHFQVIKAGQTAHFKIKIDYNQKITPHLITNMYAVGGKSKTFFFEFLTRPVAAGNLDNATAPGNNATITGRGLGRPAADVSIRWTKSKQFLLDRKKVTNTLNVRGARPAYKYFGIIEPDGDRKIQVTNATNDGNEDAEDINPDVLNEVNGTMGGFIDINIGDVTIL